MLSGIRRFAVTNNNGRRELISSPYHADRATGTRSSRRMHETLAAGDAFGVNVGGFSSGQTVVSKNVAMGMLEELLPQDRHIRNRIFRDIYYHDAVAGGAVDIYATLPWSDFYLTGLRDRDALDVYHKSVESMRLKLLLPAISRDYMVLGVFIGTTVFDADENIFSAVMPQNIDFCEIVEVPIYGMDPLITLKVPESTRKLFTNAKDPRIAKILDYMPAELADSFRGGSIPLEPENTLYIPRRTITSDMIGTSYYERILPLHLMEKALFRGSIDAAYRRQRSILHVMVGGDGDDYVPTQADMESQRDLWLAADQDPTGAIIVTRTGVQPNEVRSASDFWRVDETFDFFSSGKYRALGINESFITGEASYNCIYGGSLIPTEQGLLRIDEICADHTAGFQDIKLTVASHAGNHTARSWFNNGKAPTNKIVLANGAELIATPKHPIFVLDSAGKLAKVPTGDLAIDDLVAVPVQKTVRHQPLALNLTPALVTVERGGVHKPIRQPQYMTPELAYLIGVQIAEGSVISENGRGRGIVIANASLAILDKLDHCLNYVFGLTASRRLMPSNQAMVINGNATQNTQPCWEWRVNSTNLFNWLHTLGVIGQRGRHTAIYKTLPWAIRQADKTSQVAFLAGYMDGDGSVRRDASRAVFISAAKKLRQEIHLLLLSHGIFSRISRLVVEVTSHDCDKLFAELNPHLVVKATTATPARKARKLYGFPVVWLRKAIEQRKVKRNRYGAVFTNDAGQQITIHGYRFLHQHGYYESRILYDKYDNGDYTVFLDHLQQISQTLHQQLMRLLELRYHYVAVRALLKGKRRPVYDLSMNATLAAVQRGADKLRPAAFVANGMLTGNTADQAMTVFIEQMRSYRALLTQEIFYLKIFPAIALANDFTRDQYQVLANKRDKNLDAFFNGTEWVTNGEARNSYVAMCRDERLGLNVHNKNVRLEDLAIPHIIWQKHLRPEGDQSYMELLDSMQQKGIPVPLAMISAAGGMDIRSVLNSMEEDVNIRKKVKKYMDRIAEFAPQPSGDETEAQARALAVTSRFGVKRPVGLFNRDFDPKYLPHERNKNGRYRTTTKKGRDRIYNRLNKVLAEGMARAAERDNRSIKQERKENRKVMVHGKFGVIK